jgi:Legionella pneumophila major outer membrane protein precursor
MAMSRSMHRSLSLAMVALLPSVASVWAVDQTPGAVANRAADGPAIESVDEPFLVIPKAPVASERKPAAEKPAILRTRSKPAKPIADGADADSGIILTAADEPAPAEAPRRRSAAAPKSAAPNTIPDGYEFEMGDVPTRTYPMPNPGYHPPRVRRKSLGWYIRGTEPGGHGPGINATPGPPPIVTYEDWHSSGAAQDQRPAEGATEEIKSPSEPIAVPEQPPADELPPRVSRKAAARRATAVPPRPSNDLHPVPEPAPVRKAQRPAVNRGANATEYFDQSESLFPNPRSAEQPNAARRSGAWYLTSAEGEDAASDLIPTPEEPDDSEPYMPFSHDDDVVMDPGPFDGGSEFVPYTLPNRKWALIAGGEALLLRPHFSQATALTEGITTQSGSGTFTTNDMINFNPGYQGAFRTYLGMRDCLCGDEIRFTFLNFNSAQNLGATATANTRVCDFLCNTTPNPGDSVSTHFGLGVSVWDLDCVRPFFYLPRCRDPCGPQCHLWDLRWFAGLRAAYINHNISSLVTDATAPTGIFAQASASNKFTGFGPRIGLQGRKYFGNNGRWSVYARGAGSMLVGNVYQDVIDSSPNGGLTTATALVSRSSRIVPVAEIELGGTWFVMPRLAVSGGWMLMSFWDLGLQETGSMSAPTLDNSNILGFDGFFIRGELVF